MLVHQVLRQGLSRIGRQSRPSLVVGVVDYELSRFAAEERLTGLRA
jgi:hypothetical protein